MNNDDDDDGGGGGGGNSEDYDDVNQNRHIYSQRESYV